MIAQLEAVHFLTSRIGRCALLDRSKRYFVLVRQIGSRTRQCTATVREAPASAFEAHDDLPGAPGLGIKTLPQGSAREPRAKRSQRAVG